MKVKVGKALCYSYCAFICSRFSKENNSDVLSVANFLCFNCLLFLLYINIAQH